MDTVYFTIIRQIGQNRTALDL